MGVVSEAIYKNLQASYYACREIEKKTREIEYTVEFFKHSFRNIPPDELFKLLEANQKLMDYFYSEMNKFDENDFQ
jgi:hypothetical protein